MKKRKVVWMHDDCMIKHMSEYARYNCMTKGGNENMKNKLDTIKDSVEVLLEADERCRNDDHWLVWRFIRDVQGINMFIPFEDFKKMASFESITRARRMIQNNNGKFLPTEETKMKKRKKRKWWQW